MEPIRSSRGTKNINCLSLNRINMPSLQRTSSPDTTNHTLLFRKRNIANSTCSLVSVPTEFQCQQSNGTPLQDAAPAGRQDP